MEKLFRTHLCGTSKRYKIIFYSFCFMKLAILSTKIPVWSSWETHHFQRSHFSKTSEILLPPCGSINHIIPFSQGSTMFPMMNQSMWNWMFIPGLWGSQCNYWAGALAANAFSHSTTTILYKSMVAFASSTEECPLDPTWGKKAATLRHR